MTPHISEEIEDGAKICGKCTGQGGTEDVICSCCNGRGMHYKIPIPKKPDDDLKAAVRRFEEGTDIVDNELDWGTFTALIDQRVVKNVKNELRHIVEGDIDGVFYTATTIAQRAKDRLKALQQDTSKGELDG